MKDNERDWWFPVVNDEKIFHWYKNLNRNKNYFNTESDASTFELFKEIMYLPGNIFIESNNYVLRFYIGINKAELHGFVFNHNAIRDIATAKKSIEKVIYIFKLSVVCCIIPTKMSSIRRLIKRIGFTDTGKKITKVFNSKPVECDCYEYRG